MKKTYTLLALLTLLVSFISAQNTYNVVIFSEDGEPFYAFVNGVRQNDQPETNIRVINLNSEICNLRVTFENKALPQLKQNMYPEKGFEHTVNIKKNKKQEIKMRYFGKTELVNAPHDNATTIPYHVEENPIQYTNSQPEVNVVNDNSNTNNSNVSVSSTTTTTQINNNPNNGAVSINIGGMGINMNVNDNMNVQSSSSSTVTTTTTSYSSSSSTGINKDGNTSPKFQNQNTTMPVEQTQVINNSGCSGAMPSASFEKMKKNIADKPFSDTKMSTAKVASKNACLSSDQIQKICALFSMDADKLEFAKHAYKNCVDKANYYTISSIFSFSTTTDEFNHFLEGQH